MLKLNIKNDQYQQF